MVLRENNCGMKDIFCGYTVQGRGVQSQCYFSILFSPTILSLWVIVDLQYLALTYLFFSVSPIGFSILLCKQLSLFHHSDRVSLLKVSESTEARKLYMHTVCLIMVCNLITVSTIWQNFLFKQSSCDGNLCSLRIT